MGVEVYDSGCDDVIVKSQISSYVLLFPLSTGVLFELKMVTSFFVKNVEQAKYHSCTIDIRLDLFRFIYAWDCVAACGNVDRGKRP